MFFQKFKYKYRFQQAELETRKGIMLTRIKLKDTEIVQCLFSKENLMKVLKIKEHSLKLCSKSF